MVAKKKTTKRPAKKASAKTSASSKRGRKTKYTKAIADKIIVRMYEGESLRSICRDLGYHEATVRSWANSEAGKHDDFGKRYDRAQELRMDAIADEILEISDDGQNDWMEKIDKDGNHDGWKVNGEHIQRSRLRVDTRKFLLAKLAAAKYGDKLEVHTKKSVADASDAELLDALKRSLEGAGEDGAAIMERLLDSMGMGLPAPKAPDGEG